MTSIEMKTFGLPFSDKTYIGNSIRGYLDQLLRDSDNDLDQIKASLTQTYQAMRKLADDPVNCLVAVSLENELQGAYLRLIREPENDATLVWMQKEFSVLDDPIKSIAKKHFEKIHADVVQYEKVKETIQAVTFNPKSVGSVKPAAMQQVYEHHFFHQSFETIRKPFGRVLAEHIAYGGFQHEPFARLYLVDPASFRKQAAVVERSIGIEGVRRKRRFKSLKKYLMKCQKEGSISKGLDVEKFTNGCVHGMKWVKPKDNEFIAAWKSGGWTASEAIVNGVDLDLVCCTVIEGMIGRKPSPMVVKNHLKFYESVIDHITDETKNKILGVMAWMLSRSVIDRDIILVNAANRVIKEVAGTSSERLAAYLHANEGKDRAPEEAIRIARDVGKELTTLLKELSSKNGDEMALYKSLDMLDSTSRRLGQIKKKSLISDFGL